MLFRCSLIVLVSALLGGLNALVNPDRPAWSQEALAEGEMSVEQAIALEASLFVDARTADQFATGAIEGAILLNEDDWESLIEGFLIIWDPEVPVIIYCDSLECGASQSVRERLIGEYGIENAFVLKGGWQAWQAR